MTYACFLKFRTFKGVCWEFQYMATSDDARDLFVHYAEDLMNQRILGREILGYNVYGLPE